MKLLITGASGFIGRHVLARLEHCADVDVTVLSRREMATPPDVTTIVSDLSRDCPDWSDLGRPDIVLDLAWGGLPNYLSSHHFDEAHRHLVFLRKIAGQGLARIVCAGSCYEYGMQQGCLTEDMITAPSNPYGLAKDVLRKQLEFDHGSAELIWARFFYLYGEGQAPSSLYSQVTAAIAREDSVFPMSHGEQIRDFLPVEQAVDYLIRLTLSNVAHGIYNISSGNPVSIRRLVESWFAQSGHSIALDLGHYPYPDWEPLAFWGSTERLRGALAQG
ncbi:NAD(P)-dependent oxidoreductase [uncultured Sphingomonas sp.]|uniref:NAD-dependent epimerase/dehydratase family protein n=1 Tax=uncultured Sphingomonas sp. TaxID=158754 RepID=UPI0026323088|nr:NAD(P)-dependent oxidoreductase [uncultured Sphingomonas sp.]